jgi:hypothetical protein
VRACTNTFARLESSLKAVSRKSEFNLYTLPFDAETARDGFERSSQLTFGHFSEVMTKELTDLTSKVTAEIPQCGWEACVDALLHPSNSAILEALINQKYFKSLTATAAILDADLKGLKSLHGDGLCEIVDRAVMKAASDAKTRAINSCGITYCAFTVDRAIRVQANYKKRLELIKGLRDAMKDKGIAIPKDCEELMTLCSEQSFKVVAASVPAPPVAAPAAPPQPADCPVPSGPAPPPAATGPAPPKRRRVRRDAK